MGYDAMSVQFYVAFIRWFLASDDCEMSAGIGTYCMGGEL